MTESASIEQSLLDRLQTLGCIRLEDSNSRILEVSGHGQMPALELPANSIAFDSNTGYWLSLAAFRNVPNLNLIVGQVHSFALDTGAGDWAIPGAYEPKDERQALMRHLGFDEGWEHSVGGPFFLITVTQPWRSMLSMTLEQRQMILTVVGADSLYPMSISRSVVSAIEIALAQS